MMIFGHDLSFWVAVTLASLFKVRASEERSWLNVIFTFSASVFAAWVFTDPMLVWLSLDPESYKIPIAVIIGLIGESIMKRLTSIDTEALDKMFKHILSRGK